MSNDEFEQKLARQPLRPVPPEWRGEILHVARAAAPAAERSRLRDLLQLLLWPSPRAWGALAAAWVVIVAANLVMNSGGPTVAPAPMAGGNWRAQQRLLAELLNGGEMPAPQKTPKLSPRSEGRGTNSKFETRNSRATRNPRSEWVCDVQNGGRQHRFTLMAMGLVVPPSGGSMAGESPDALLQAKACTTSTRQERSAVSFAFRICFEFQISNFEFGRPFPPQPRA